MSLKKVETGEHKMTLTDSDLCILMSSSRSRSGMPLTVVVVLRHRINIRQVVIDMVTVSQQGIRGAYSS